ncbi:MAG: cupin domain-containing protein, partial [Bacteroidota bacterium]
IHWKHRQQKRVEMNSPSESLQPGFSHQGKIAARDAMEQLNAEAAAHNIWLRTQANAPAQRPWFRDTVLEASGKLSPGKVGAGQLKALPHHWKWAEISPYLHRIAEISRNADVSPSEFADRQQFLLLNPGMGGRLQVASAIRCAVSIYNPRDVAPVHVHTPNASRTILSESGGYTTVEGERCQAARGDIILTPNGTWHDHGNDGAGPVMWVDILDWPLLEFLDCIWLDDSFPGKATPDRKAQESLHASGYSKMLYGAGGIVPATVSHKRGFGRDTTPMVHYSGADIREALHRLRAEAGDRYEGIWIKFRNPVTGASLFPTLEYAAQLLRPGETTELKRETASTVYIVMEGGGVTEVAGRTFNWQTNDIFVIPNFLWRRHINIGTGDAVLYTISDVPLLEKMGQYRAQGRTNDGVFEELVP